MGKRLSLPMQNHTLMTEDDIKELRRDPDGLHTYEYLANHIGECEPSDIELLIDNMERVDLSGQFMASAARYLNAIDSEGYSPAIRRLVAATIDKDREHRYQIGRASCRERVF